MFNPHFRSAWEPLDNSWVVYKCFKCKYKSWIVYKYFKSKYLYSMPTPLLCVSNFCRFLKSSGIKNFFLRDFLDWNCFSIGGNELWILSLSLCSPMLHPAQADLQVGSQGKVQAASLALNQLPCSQKEGLCCPASSLVVSVQDLCARRVKRSRIASSGLETTNMLQMAQGRNVSWHCRTNYFWEMLLGIKTSTPILYSSWMQDFWLGWFLPAEETGK